MTVQEQEKYKNAEPKAVCCLSNWGGVEIMDIEYGIEDYVIARYNYGEPQECHRCKIHYGSNVSSFRLGRRTIRLDQCMRV